MRRSLRLSLATALLLAASLTACTDDPPPVEAGRRVLSPGSGTPHTHVTQVGDGTTAAAGGYAMTDLVFPERTREPADVRFRIVDARGEPVTDFVEEQTKLLHLYVVRDDLGDFRHLHPTLADDGTWTARVDLTDPGRYRVVAEFRPGDQPDDDQVVLGREALVAGASPPPGEAPGTQGGDGLVMIDGPSSLAAGQDAEFAMTVSDGDGGVVNLGTYLGSYAHLTAFQEETGAFEHAHPLGSPEVGERGSELVFHTAFDAPGTYRLFVQVRVDGFVHTVPLTTQVT